MATLRFCALVLLAHAAALALAFAALMLTPLPASAQIACMPWDALRPAMADLYGEVPVGGGMINERMALRILVSPDGATCTIVTIDIAGRACPIASGTDWDPGTIPAQPDQEG